jgi:hypothetical protein
MSPLCVIAVVGTLVLTACMGETTPIAYKHSEA